MYYGSVGVLIRLKDRTFRRSLRILNSYGRTLVKTLWILLGFQLSMKNRRRQIVPHQTCDRVCMNICRLRTTIYVSSFLTRLSHCLLAKKQPTFYLTYFRTHNKFPPNLILKVLSQPKISKSRNWLSIHLHLQAAPLLFIYSHRHQKSLPMWSIMRDMIHLRPSMRGLQTHGTKGDIVYY